jgi:hypothetical protein
MHDEERRRSHWYAWGVLVVMASAGPAAWQSPTNALVPRSDISARDGDRIVVEDDALVQIVRRRQATIRAIFSEEERLLIVLVDYVKPGEFPDGMVDWAFNFYDIDGTWPLGPRWEGLTAIFQYQGAQSRPRGLAFETPQGLVQIVPRPSESALPDPRASVILSHGATSSGPRLSVSFAEAETLQLSDAARTKASGAIIGTATPPAGSGTTARGTLVVGTGRGTRPAPPANADGTATYAYFLRDDATPPPPGQEIAANHGDRVIVDDDARVQVVRRRQGMIRAIFNHEQRTLIVLADYARAGQPPDGKVDSGFNFYNLEGTWPASPRWEALTTLFHFEGDPQSQLPGGYALVTPQGLVHLSPRLSRLREPAAAATAVIWFAGSRTSHNLSVSFAEAEKRLRLLLPR